MEFIGRLHPLILHLPIGFLILAYLMEWFGKKRKKPGLTSAVGFALQLGMWAAIVSALSGYILSLEEGYERSTVSLHQWLGVATTLLAILMYYLHKKKNELQRHAHHILSHLFQSDIPLIYNHNLLLLCKSNMHEDLDANNYFVDSVHTH